MKTPLLFGKDHPYDVIVCGGGHAGCEAALAAARMGCATLLLSGNLDTLGQMSCNPAIGGEAKGHMVREMDALGGEMALNADLTAIQFRLLNASRGPAVHSPRVQSDKKAYQLRMKHTLELQPGLKLFQATVERLIIAADAIVGVGTQLGIEFYSQTVILTTGTFLRALLHVGQNQSEGGRMGDMSAKGLSASLQQVGIELGRLKTGTPCRLSGRSLDFSQLLEQKGDAQPTRFAFYDTRPQEALFHVEHSHCQQKRLGWPPHENQVSCWSTHTTEATQALIEKNRHRSPLYQGQITGTGPRYCPSIEEKYARFNEKSEHRLFLEPEGRNTDEWYINGLSTSLPFDVQAELLLTIPGLEHAQITRPAYAVEYDFAPPTQLYASLESKKVQNLFFAGQINGTTGYAEAGAQGLMAGINAALKARGEAPCILKRHDAYIGVLIDDLVTKGTREPYRMFTSRAEHRLLLNHGSAQFRLYEHAQRLGLVPKNRLALMQQHVADIHTWREYFEHTPSPQHSLALSIRQGQLPSLPEAFLALPAETQSETLYQVTYKGYREREERHLRKFEHLDAIKVPQHFDFSKLPSLSSESRQKLSAIAPSSLGQASRISGITPADISVLMIYLQRTKEVDPRTRALPSQST